MCRCGSGSPTRRRCRGRWSPIRRTLLTRFPDKREEDAFVTFEIENGQPVRATMKGVSPDIDFSYDYQDLRLMRV